MERFECKRCVNRASPLCEICTTITSPGGKENKPRYYVKQGDIENPIVKITFPHNKSEVCKKKALSIGVFLQNGVPIPMKLVMEYNRLAEEEYI